MRMRTAEPMMLNEDERTSLQRWVHRGHAAARIQTRARMRLKRAEGWRDVAIARAWEVGVGTVYHARQRDLAGGLEAVLHDQVQARRRQALAGEQMAYLIATAGSPAPKGHDHWTLRLLAGKAVEVGCVPSIAPETIRHARQKTSASPGSMTSGACPGWARRVSRRWKSSSTALQSHQTKSRPRAATRLLRREAGRAACAHAPLFAPQSRPPRAHRRGLRPGGHGQRLGLVLVAPHLGWRHAEVTERRTHTE
jgi:hypothetical protein